MVFVFFGLSKQSFYCPWCASGKVTLVTDIVSKFLRFLNNAGIIYIYIA
jgi:hypothetical protein